MVRHLIYMDYVQYSSGYNLRVRWPSFQPNTWVWFIMSITHCIIMVMHAMLFIMAGLVRLPASSSCRSFRNEFSGFGVFMLNPISVCGMPSASGCDILVSHAVFGFTVNVTGASRCGGHFCPGAFRYGGHLCHPGSFAQTSGALGAYCEIFIKDSCSTRPSGAKRW